MTAEEVELLAFKAGCRVPRVMPRKKREGHVCHVLLFHGPTGRKEVEIALDATTESAQAVIQAAVSG